MINNTKITTITTVLIIVVFILLIFLTYLSLILNFESKRLKPRCSDFGSYYEALDSYKQGNLRLDKNRNKVPCESLVK